MHEKGTNVAKGFNNFGNISIEEYRNINPLMVLNHKYLVISGADKIFAGAKAEAKAEAKEKGIKEEKVKAAEKKTVEKTAIEKAPVAKKPVVAKKEKPTSKK
jgi:hypothetical protein